MTITPKIYYESPEVALNDPQRAYLRKEHNIYPIRAFSLSNARGYVTDWISASYKIAAATPPAIMLRDGVGAFLVSKTAELANVTALEPPSSDLGGFCATDVGTAILGIAQASMYRAHQVQVTDGDVQNALAIRH